MFSGIIKNIGIVKSAQEEHGGRRFVIQTNISGMGQAGESVLLSGVCSTIIEVAADALTFFYMPETLKKTTIPLWETGTRVNIEASLKAGDSLGGHFVYGHVDGKAMIQDIKIIGESKEFTLKVPQELSMYLVPKGSVALDGVSLTVIDVSNGRFSIGLIPFTLTHTTFGLRKIGEEVNIEVDMLARYIVKLCKEEKEQQ